ncbi:MAG: hypothetical protein QNJ84_10690 [Alphaproteobacteria bacterium]|nr:hypothetical protein [Alphaproteobacteria bacterium]
MTDNIQNETQNPKKDAPIQTLRDGAVVVKLWRQESEKGPFVSATLGRTYQDKRTGEYRESRSLGGGDVLKAQALLLEANREMVKWRDHFRDQQREQDRKQEQAQAVHAPQPEAAPQPHQDLAAERDAALANAKQRTPETPVPAQGPSYGPER